MKFEEFFNLIPKIEKLPLPGPKAHLEMAPASRIRELRKLGMPPGGARQAGVLALVYPGDRGMAHLLLIRRPAYPGVHGNQVALPGGKMEPGDLDLLGTALREAWEEVGVEVASVQPVRPLTTLYIPPSNFEVSPFLGMVGHRPEFQLQASEVAALIEVPVSRLVDPGSLGTHRLATSYAREAEVPVFRFQGQVVWGATAMILNELRYLFKAGL